MNAFKEIITGRGAGGKRKFARMVASVGAICTSRKTIKGLNSCLGSRRQRLGVCGKVDNYMEKQAVSCK
jgi:hypothetical protein